MWANRLAIKSAFHGIGKAVSTKKRDKLSNYLIKLKYYPVKESNDVVIVKGKDSLSEISIWIHEQQNIAQRGFYEE